MQQEIVAEIGKYDEEKMMEIDDEIKEIFQKNILDKFSAIQE